MESIGTRLKNARLGKGLSLEEVHKRTKIHLNVLKAIEEDSLVNLNPVYIKGFLKIYCNTLGLDPNEYSSGINDAKPSAPFFSNKENGPSFASGAPQPRLRIPLPRIRIKPLILAVFILLGLVVVLKIGKFIVQKRKESAQARKEQLTVMPSAKSENKSQRGKAKTEKIPQASSLRLGIHARDNCYVTLKADGRVVFQGNLRKGLSESWQAKEKMELSLSNAGAVDLEINGKLISKLGRKGEAVKNILINREDGLVIPR